MHGGNTIAPHTLSAMNIEQARREAEDNGRSEAASATPFLYRRGVVLGLLFFVTLFLGWPLLWMSPRFSTLSKVVITLVNLAYSVLVLWGFYLLMAWCYARISGALM